jgi:AcrR family transcriptional regulator
MSLVERRQLRTRWDIAQAACKLFLRDGYDNVTAEVIAEEVGASLRTFYRYFSSKDETLSPIITSGTAELAEHIAARPAEESLADAVRIAYAQISAAVGLEQVRQLITLLTSVPALRARWLHDLRTIEDALVPAILQRTADLSDNDARLTAAVIVTCLRVSLEQSTRSESEQPLADTLGCCLQYLRRGAHL